MMREIIRIDEEKCDGCGLCVTACVEGALRIVDGKAKLVKDVYCDGLGACVGDCPRGALTVERREAEPFDEEEVRKHKAEPAVKRDELAAPAFGGCPGSAVRMFRDEGAPGMSSPAPRRSRLGHWPVQLMLVSPSAPFLKGAEILVCADCVPFAVPDFHDRFLAGRAVLVGCPKLDDLAFYRDKLADVFREAAPSGIALLRMEVPCCGGMEKAAVDARDRVVPGVPIRVHVIGIDGDVRMEAMR